MWPAIIGAAGSVLSAGASMVSTGKLNKKNRQWQEMMWNKTNAYNSPVQQMARFKEAGLNPHLIYGQGNSGNTSMPAAPKQEQADFSGFADAAMNYVAVRKQQTEIDNLEKAREVMEADKTQKAAQTASILQSTARSRFDLEQAERLKDIVFSTAEANLSNTVAQGARIQADISQILANTRLTDVQRSKVAQDILESIDRMRTAKAQRDNLSLDNELKKLDIQLQKAGIQKSDPAYMRIMTRLFNKLDLGNIFRDLGDTYYKKLFKGEW